MNPWKRTQTTVNASIAAPQSLFSRGESRRRACFVCCGLFVLLLLLSSSSVAFDASDAVSGDARHRQQQQQRRRQRRRRRDRTEGRRGPGDGDQGEPEALRDHHEGGLVQPPVAEVVQSVAVQGAREVIKPGGSFRWIVAAVFRFGGNCQNVEWPNFRFGVKILFRFLMLSCPVDCWCCCRRRSGKNN